MARKKSKKTISADIALSILGDTKHFKVTVPETPCGPDEVLPFAQSLTNEVVGKAIHMVEAEGKSIACCKGCGACCSQLVPITETEARHIADLIKSFPKDRKKAVMQRFEQAREQFQQAGLWQQLNHPETLDTREAKAFGIRYFKENVPCPFLEDGACSIHPQRPLACREYLVTSDPKHCAEPDQGEVEGVPIPWKLSKVLGKLWQGDSQHRTEWIPLVVAPYWRKQHPENPSKKTGPEWVDTFLGHLKDNT